MRWASFFEKFIKPTPKMISKDLPHVISIIGTTGVGKSQLSIELLQKFNGEIINADSMQMYKKLDTITNKHPIEERYGVPHHVMNHVDWSDEYDMHRFKKELLDLISDIHSRGKLPIIVGGTHYYLQSVLFTNKMVVTNTQDETTKLKDSIQELSEEQVAILEGPEDQLIVELLKRDPVMANKFHPNDHRRIKRSLEIFFKTGNRLSDIYETQKQVEGSSLRFNTLFLWVWSEQPVLNERLDTRVDKMMSAGGMDEIRELFESYQSQDPKPDCERGVWQVIGFKEFLPWLTAGDSEDSRLLRSCIEDMKVRTRRYSKRQVKWIKNTLCESLQRELDFDHCGRIFLLDATNLDVWKESVNQRGGEITEAFLVRDSEALSKKPSTPPGLEEMIPAVQEATFTGTEQKHQQCEVCKDLEGKPLVVLARQWQLHLNGSKHRSSLRRGKRKRDYEEWLNKKKQ